MTWVPASASDTAVLPAPSPIVGGVAEINRAGELAQLVADDSFDYRQSVQAAERSLGAGQSAAITELRDKLANRLLPGADALDESARAAKKGFGSYASDVESIHSEARAIVESVELDLGTIRTQAGAIAEIAQVIGASVPGEWTIIPPGTMPEPQLGMREQGLSSTDREAQRQILVSHYSTQWLYAASGWKDAYDSITSAKSRWGALAAERRESEARLLAGLRATDLGRLIAAGSSGSRSLREMVAYGFSGELRGGSLADGVVNPAVDELLQRTDLSGAALTEAWNALGLSPEQIAELPMSTLAQLTNRNGLPAWVQDIASTELMHYALAAPDKAYALFGFGTTGPGIAEFRSQIGSLYDAWEDAKSAARLMGGEPVIQLLALGSHDGALTAAISHGDLDTASRVGVNASGMFSSVAGIGQDAKAARSLYNEAFDADPTHSYAAVTWIGYHAPDLGEVASMVRAEAGGPRLAAFIDGIYDSREANTRPIENFTVFGHSYGSTIAAVALMETRHRVDSFVTYGSAGLSRETSVGDLRADKVFSTHASMDLVAGWGKANEHPVNPVWDSRVQVFSSEGDAEHKRVTEHSMFTEDASSDLTHWFGNVGYLTTGTKSAEDMGKIWAYGGL